MCQRSTGFTADSRGFTCDCNMGYMGKNCTETACSSNPCQNGASCWPGNGTYTCWCLPGYAGEQCNLGPYITMDGNTPNDRLAGNLSNFGFRYVQELNLSDFSYAPGHSLQR